MRIIPAVLIATTTLKMCLGSRIPITHQGVFEIEMQNGDVIPILIGTPLPVKKISCNCRVLNCENNELKDNNVIHIDENMDLSRVEHSKLIVNENIGESQDKSDKNFDVLLRNKMEKGSSQEPPEQTRLFQDLFT